MSMRISELRICSDIRESPSSVLWLWVDEENRGRCNGIIIVLCCYIFSADLSASFIELNGGILGPYSLLLKEAVFCP